MALRTVRAFDPFNPFGYQLAPRRAFPSFTPFDFDFDSLLPSIKSFKQLNEENENGVRVIDKDDRYEVVNRLPGIKSEDLNVEYDSKNKTLTISGTTEETRDDNVLYRTSFERTVTVPEINEDGISAKLKGDVITITLPKVEPSEPEQKDEGKEDSEDSAVHESSTGADNNGNEDAANEVAGSD
uniref:ARAD1C45276p n=1 Tax=Blastobotrys adeninivorans TaxID=409370 RepID=A0A060TAE8_BLAAD